MGCHLFKSDDEKLESLREQLRSVKKENIRLLQEIEAAERRIESLSMCHDKVSSKLKLLEKQMSGLDILKSVNDRLKECNFATTPPTRDKLAYLL